MRYWFFLTTYNSALIRKVWDSFSAPFLFHDIEALPLELVLPWESVFCPMGIAGIRTAL